tara:strand:+ start:270 stop:1058 length:789 start_codon:yes stop_codon:yes gene_type:complete
MADQFTAGESFAEDEQLTHTKLNRAQTNLKFTDDAVDGTTLQRSGEKLAVKNGGIDTDQLNDAAVETAKINDGAVETAKINDGAVTNAKLGADAVNGDKIADNAIDSEHYTDASIDQEHLNNDVITGQGALSATPSLTDTILISDADDAGNLKKIELMKHLPLPRAYGILKMTGYGVATGDAKSLYNCTCTAASSLTYTFDLGSNMSSADYTVLAQQHSTVAWDDEDDNVTVEIDDENTFKIHIATHLSPYHVSFAVFGTLA